MNEVWHWLTETDGGLMVRILVGVCIFTFLGVTDFIRHRSRATRWREYLFLLAAVGVALVYGVINDQITVRLSPEYFLYGKGLEPLVGNDLNRLPWEAAKVGIKATWSVGLVIGVAFLLANNPRRDRPRLPYRDLLRHIVKVLAMSILCAAAMGVIGRLGGLVFFSEDFRQMVAHDEFRPRRFMGVYGIHLGGYVGGLAGTVWAVVSIFRQRRSFKVHGQYP